MTHEYDLAQVWVYLSASPLFGLTMTLLAYGLAYRVYVWGKSNPLLNPVVTAVALLIALLWLTHTPYQAYFEGGQFVHFLLGPATVALALPESQGLGLPMAIVAGAGQLLGCSNTLCGSTMRRRRKPLPR